MIAMTLYKTRKIFSNFDDKDYTAFIYKLNSLYKLPNTWLFSSYLLDEVYDNIYKQVQIVLNKCTYFNFITDSLINAQHDCIVNLSIYTEMNIFQLESGIIPSIKHNNEELAK